MAKRPFPTGSSIPASGPRTERTTLCPRGSFPTDPAASTSPLSTCSARGTWKIGSTSTPSSRATGSRLGAVLDGPRLRPSTYPFHVSVYPLASPAPSYMSGRPFDLKAMTRAGPARISNRFSKRGRPGGSRKCVPGDRSSARPAGTLSGKCSLTDAILNRPLNVI